MHCNTKLSEEELLRYSRQIRLTEVGKEGQNRIKGTSVLVIGAGALGCAVLQYLTAAGIGELGIVDNDWVDETNLNRQVLYSARDIGKPKPLAAKAKLKILNPEVRIRIHFIRMDKLSALKIIRQYNIIVDCTDNFSSRYLINDACVIMKKPLVYGAIHRFSGQVMVLNYLGGPTLRCLYPEVPHPLEMPSCEEFGVIGSVTGIIGAFQANEVLKIVLELDGVLSGKLFMIDTLNFNSSLLQFKRDTNQPAITELGKYEDIDLCNYSSVKEITSADLRKMISEKRKVLVIDLRDNDDKDDIGFKSIHVRHFDVSRKIRLFDGNDAIVFYCRSGSRSVSVINYLQKVHNLKNLYNLVL
ncbi:MAG: HesA/MoeB/ThiF family protein [Bacteroidia bacterium]|nr:HesA/MoeB/ThiF family protein [Bacteroidia bacterium]